jgi:hypothetical protein
MAHLRDLLAGFGIGAGMMYWFDPARGRHRRARLRDQMVHTCRETNAFINRGLRDLNNRLEGVAHDMQCLIAVDHPDDRTLEQRVRSKMGRHVSHAHAIEVRARDGWVTLRGSIPENEVENFLASVASVRGVRGVESELTMHAPTDRSSPLQGREALHGESFQFFHENWAPSTRLLGSGVGVAMMLNCLARRTPSAILWGTVGFGLFARAITNLPVQRLTGVDAQRCVATHGAAGID